MRDRIARIFGPPVRRAAPGAGNPRGAGRPPGRITTRLTGERPPNAEDGPPARPHYAAHAREREARSLAEPRRWRVLVVAPRGWEAAA
ncbi:MAG TPA: hypothetical protein DD420_05110 [Streptomyces sp.]|nr:hypothetical protein [Streptomyces sp.]